MALAAFLRSTPVLVASILLPAGCAATDAGPAGAPSAAGATDAAHDTPAPGPDVAPVFPTDFAGRWSGTLEVFNAPGEPVQTVGFTLEIGAEGDVDADGLPWRLTYAGQPTRDYRLQTVDASRGIYLIDERNGITMPAHFLGDTLVSRFTVSGQILVTRQRFRADRIEHEILAGPAAAATEGAGVEGLRVVGVQRATLERQDETDR